MAFNNFCGGNSTEVINLLESKLHQSPNSRLCCPYIVQRCLFELDLLIPTDKGKFFLFIIAELLDGFLVYVAVKSGILVHGMAYDYNFGHEFLE